MREEILAALVALLQGGDSATANEMARTLRFDRSSINSVLYSTPQTFTREQGQPPRWRLATTTASPSAPVRPTSRQQSRSRVRGAVDAADLRLYPWQQRALARWRAAGRCGVVEAVTGSGKTRVGLAAIATALEEGRRVLVVVPTTVLLDQWRRQISTHLGLAAGAFGGGRKADLTRHRVVVATVQSACRVVRLLPRSTEGLLVCDEVHRYGAESFARVLQDDFGWRLGMTATFERNDAGLATHLEPYFGGVVYRLGYDEALADGVIARFRVAIVRVDLSPAEQLEYDKASAEAQKARRWLVERASVPEEPFGEYIAAVARLSEGPWQETSTRQARRFLTNFSRSRQIVGESPAKLEVLRHVRFAVEASAGTLVFASTVAGARRAAEALAAHGIAAASLDSTMTREERRAVLQRFERRQLLATAAPLVLDEGVDVPEANLAVILAASKTRRQMIQRLGRVVRVKQDGGKAHLTLVVARGTSEDPASGAHLDFIEEMLRVADELRLFDAADLGSLGGFLQGGDGGRPLRLGQETSATPTRSVVAAAPATAPTPTPPATLRSIPTAAPPGTAPAPREAAALGPAPQGQPSQRSNPFDEVWETAMRSRRDRPVSVPLSLPPRIRKELAQGRQTARSLAQRLHVGRDQVIAALESSSDFVRRDVWWYLASQTPTEP